MNWAGFIESLEQVWNQKPELFLLLAVGFLVFVFIVRDAWRHKRRHKRRHH